MRTLTALSVALVATLTTSTPARADAGLLAWPQDKVYVVDRLPSAWPVASVAEMLDNDSPLDLVTVQTCPRGAQCIDIREGTLPAGVVGSTVRAAAGPKLVSANVKVTPRWRTASVTRRRALLCHELLHAVGMSHSSRKSSCLYSNMTVAPARPDGADFAMLRKMY